VAGSRFTRGIEEPDWGSFAEGYSCLTTGAVCGIEAVFTRALDWSGSGSIDLYAWGYDVASDDPGNVLSLVVAAPVSGVDYWPYVSALDFAVPPTEVPGQGFFVGYWPRSHYLHPTQFTPCFDADGPGGVPRTKIVPGIGYPTGWQDVDVVFEGAAVGLRPWVAGGPVPSERTSWSALKALYD